MAGHYFACCWIAEAVPGSPLQKLPFPVALNYANLDEFFKAIMKRKCASLVNAPSFSRISEATKDLAAPIQCASRTIIGNAHLKVDRDNSSSLDKSRERRTGEEGGFKGKAPDTNHAQQKETHSEHLPPKGQSVLERIRRGAGAHGARLKASKSMEADVGGSPPRRVPKEGHRPRTNRERKPTRDSQSPMISKLTRQPAATAARNKDKNPCLVFLDLDNTLIPTTWMMAQWRAPYSNEPFAQTVDIERERTRRINEALLVSGLFGKLDELFDELKHSLNVDMISIVTNAGSKTVEWFYLSYCIPQLKALIAKHGISIQSTERWVKKLGPPPDAAQEDDFREFYTNVKYHEFGEVLQSFVPNFTADPTLLEPESPSPASRPAVDEDVCEKQPRGTAEMEQTVENQEGMEFFDTSSNHGRTENGERGTPTTTTSTSTSGPENEESTGFDSQDQNSVEGWTENLEKATQHICSICSVQRETKPGDKNEDCDSASSGVCQCCLSPQDFNKGNNGNTPSTSSSTAVTGCAPISNQDSGRDLSIPNPLDSTENSGEHPENEASTGSRKDARQSSISSGSSNTSSKSRRSGFESRGGESGVNQSKSNKMPRIDVVSVGDQMCEITAACRLTKDYNHHVHLAKLLIICDGIEPCIEVQTPTSFVKQLEWLRIHMLQLLRNNTETLDQTGERAQWKVSPKRSNFLFSVSQPHRFAGPYPQLPSSTPEPQSPATETVAPPSAVETQGKVEMESLEDQPRRDEDSVVDYNESEDSRQGICSSLDVTTPTVAEEGGDESGLDVEKASAALLLGPGVRHVANMFDTSLATREDDSALDEKPLPATNDPERRDTENDGTIDGPQQETECSSVAPSGIAVPRHHSGNVHTTMSDPKKLGLHAIAVPETSAVMQHTSDGETQGLYGDESDGSILGDKTATTEDEKELIAGVSWQDVDHGNGHLLPADEEEENNATNLQRNGG